MAQITFGKNILENLTTAMYENSLVIFREYVQNSCDGVRTAMKQEHGANKYAGRIDIKINSDERSIEITDNGCGIPKGDFVRVLSDIANSDKVRGEDMGFRGIGRLCGLAYCSELQFISTVYDETEISVMTWDAEQMQSMLEDNNKYSADEVIARILKSGIDTKTADKDEHYFKVILTGIHDESDELLDVGEVRHYLSFIAPTPYTPAFLFRDKIYKHAEEIGNPIEEYSIYINDEQLFKNYKSRIYTKEGKYQDDIRDVIFQDFHASDNSLLAWIWFGISSFNGQIPECEHNPHRSLRLRKANIQIGDSDTLRRLHKEPRSNGYYIGELFAVHKDLTPNARRDYFNENACCNEFQLKIKKFFFDELYKLYYAASNIRSVYKQIDDYRKAKAEFEEKSKSGFSGKYEKQQAEEVLNTKRENFEKANRKLEKIEAETQGESDSLIKVRAIVKKTVSDKTDTKATSQTREDEANSKFIVDELSWLPKQTRKVVSRIYDVICQNAPEQAQMLISKIQESLKNSQGKNL
jgi:molecular chaperone HtpG